MIPDLSGTYQQTLFTTEEDFDFDGGGYLLSQSGGGIAALNRSGDLVIIPVPGFRDPSGLGVAASGNIRLAEPDAGVLRIVYRSNGASESILSGMYNPSAGIVMAERISDTAFTQPPPFAQVWMSRTDRSCSRCPLA